MAKPKNVNSTPSTNGNGNDPLATAKAAVEAAKAQLQAAKAQAKVKANEGRVAALLAQADKLRDLAARLKSGK